MEIWKLKYIDNKWETYVVMNDSFLLFFEEI